jgi:predicted TIM-barrel fold metal-dependent hydrolase
MDAMSDLGLAVELRAPHERCSALAAVAGRWPGVVLTLSHACLPPRRTDAALHAWRAGLRVLARHPNVVCKISAVAGVADPHWTLGSIRPWVLTPIEVFGADRCVLGTNWPVDRLFGTYRGLVDAYREVLAPLNASELAAVFHGTARRVYGVFAGGLPSWGLVAPA